MVSHTEASETTSLLPTADHRVTDTRFVLAESEKPRNWSRPYRWLCVGVISLYGLMSPVMASAVVPALPAIGEDLSMTDGKVHSTLVSVYLLSWTITPVFLGPLSEIYGRVRLLQIGHGLFLITNFLSIFARTGPQLLLLRFIAGGVGSGPLSIAAGILGDLWPPEERGLSIALYTLGPLLGPAVGPIGAAYIAANFSWRWIFGAASIYILATFILGLFTLRETCLPVITRRKRAAMLSKIYPPGQVIENDPELKHDGKTMKSLLKPFILLWSEPLVQISAIFTGVLFGLNHLIITTFQSLWRDVYQQDTLRASWNYGFIAIGFIVGSQMAGFFNDLIYNRIGKKEGNPELRVYMMLPAALMVPVGLILYGWAAERRTHWLIPDAGVALYSTGLIMSYQCTQAYIIDCYTTHAASSMSAMIVVRSITGFAFPIIGPALYDAWGYGMGSTWLAGCTAVMGVGVPVFLKAYGPSLRAKSSYVTED
ncbi:hypothetical protein O1611_g4243 [Lasiodiplodia mahajangana]|uniref:Uncharacterized protein n=1 Tax=Lasiodiplodia mahajangana TaxID=1108764 RepID=A0ACC2JPL1_9PEZI|nr:hypothetical protein O1611_g4243 [Lasiodiplodia mahajangana]